MSSEGPERRHFIQHEIADDLAAGRATEVVTRFPPEPNGYLHIGHAKSICLNFGLASEHRGRCHLRFDDTNPTKESPEFVESIQRDVRWLGFAWDGPVRYASDYFDALLGWAVAMIRAGKAYVCSLTADEIRSYRGTLTTPGRASPYRDRPVPENLALFDAMCAGTCAEGAHVLRAKIDMAHPNLNMRDPVMYRVLNAHHHRTGNRYCVYPTYDWAHGQSDAIEKISHSLCTLEFENHRPLYDWYLDAIGAVSPRPRQIEFSPLRISHTVLSKRRLKMLVEERIVEGWNDPRMPTLRGLARRGYAPEAIRAFCERVGVTKFEGVTDLGWLEDALREHLNRVAPRRMAVLDPVELVLDNYPVDLTEELACTNNPEDPSAGTRMVPFARSVLIEREDFLEEPPRKFFRLAPGREVRLRYAYLVTCTGVDKDADGRVVRLHGTYDPATRGGTAPDGRKVKATIHWVSARHAIDAEVRLYDRLFTAHDPVGEGEGERGFLAHLNSQSLVTTRGKLEPDLAGARAGAQYQFERKGYFCVDDVDSLPGAPVFNRTASLRDGWAKHARPGEDA